MRYAYISNITNPIHMTHRDTHRDTDTATDTSTYPRYIKAHIFVHE